MSETVAGVAELTAEVLTNLLGTTVRAVDARPLGIGNMSSSYRLDVTYADEAATLPESLVAKIPSAVAEVRASNARTYRTEVGFYNDVAPRVRCASPRAYHAAYDDQGNTFLLLLEDLASAEAGDQFAGCSVEQARHAVVNLAGLHASTWNEQWAQELPFVSPMRPEFADGAQAMLAAATPGFVDRFGIDARDSAILDVYAASLTGHLTARPERRSLIHSDYRPDNLMFDRRPDAPRPVVALDWATVGFGLPARDLAVFLATGLDPEIRRNHERELVAAYNEELNRDEPRQPLEETWDDYLAGMFQPVMLTVLGATLSQHSDRGDQLFKTMITRACAAIRDLDATEA